MQGGLAEEINKRCKTYISERNVEGHYIRTSLQQIQDDLVIGKSNEDPAFVDDCLEMACIPQCPMTPCMAPAVEKGKEIQSGILKHISFKPNDKKTKVILLGVVDVSKDASDPVPFIYDGDISRDLQYYTASKEYAHNLFLEKMQNFQSAEFRIDMYKKVNSKQWRHLLTKPLSNIETSVGITNVLSEVEKHNQSTTFGILRFLDAMAKGGIKMKCTKEVETFKSNDTWSSLQDQHT
jgi:hypothetical protein